MICSLVVIDQIITTNIYYHAMECHWWVWCGAPNFLLLVELKEYNLARHIFGDVKPKIKLTRDTLEKALTKKNNRCGRNIKRTPMISETRAIFHVGIVQKMLDGTSCAHYSMTYYTVERCIILSISIMLPSNEVIYSLHQQYLLMLLSVALAMAMMTTLYEKW